MLHLLATEARAGGLPALAAKALDAALEAPGVGGAVAWTTKRCDVAPAYPRYCVGSERLVQTTMHRTQKYIDSRDGHCLGQVSKLTTDKANNRSTVVLKPQLIRTLFPAAIIIVIVIVSLNGVNRIVVTRNELLPARLSLRRCNCRGIYLRWVPNKGVNDGVERGLGGLLSVSRAQTDTPVSTKQKNEESRVCHPAYTTRLRPQSLRVAPETITRAYSAPTPPRDFSSPV